MSPAAALPPLVITGANGFVGRQVLAILAARGVSEVVALSRDGALLEALPFWRPAWRAVSCDLTRDVVPTVEIARGATVLHLAAGTGKLAPSAMHAVNVEGTRRVLQAARAAHAAHVVFVSSIAAGFRDRRWYPYAESKREAERLVTAGGVPFSIVRPTIIFGRGSAVGAALQGLATGRAPIVLGSGRVRVQPVHVDDVVTFLLALAAGAPSGGDVLEVGGADRLTMTALLAAIREALQLPPRRVIPIPLGALRFALGTVESILRPVLPVTAGQLAAFVNDSTAARSTTADALLPSPMGVREMIERERAPTLPAALGAPAADA